MWLFKREQLSSTFTRWFLLTLMLQRGVKLSSPQMESLVSTAMNATEHYFYVLRFVTPNNMVIFEIKDMKLWMQKSISEFQKSHFQNEATCKTFLAKTRFNCTIIKVILASLWNRGLEQLENGLLRLEGVTCNIKEYRKVFWGLFEPLYLWTNHKVD